MGGAAPGAAGAWHFLRVLHQHGHVWSIGIIHKICAIAAG